MKQSTKLRDNQCGSQSGSLLVEFDPDCDGVSTDGTDVDAKGALVTELVPAHEGCVLVPCHAHLTQRTVVPCWRAGGGGRGYRQLLRHTGCFGVSGRVKETDNGWGGGRKKARVMGKWRGQTEGEKREEVRRMDESTTIDREEDADSHARAHTHTQDDIE